MIIIDSCAFGTITVDGREYRSDIIIYPDGRVDDRWWRKKSHLLTLEDIDDLLSSLPHVIVVGTGMDGLMKPDPQVEKLLAERGIRFLHDVNPKAIKIFNELAASDKRVGACFHLTC